MLKINIIKIILVLVSTTLLAITGAVLFSLLESFGIFPNLGGHGLGNIGYLFYGFCSGLVVGLGSSLFVVIKRERKMLQYFFVIIGVCIFTSIALFIGVRFFSLGW